MSTLPSHALPTWPEWRFAYCHGQNDTCIETGEDYPTDVLGALWSMEPTAKPKRDGVAMIPSSYAEYDARNHQAQRERGQFVALCGDVDGGNHDVDKLARIVDAFADGAAWLIYSSAHSMPGDQRWRIVVPLADVQGFDAWYDAQLAFFAYMESAGVEMDHALSRAGQLVYLPNIPPKHKSGTALRGDDGTPLYFERRATPMELPGLALERGPVSEGVAAIRKQRAIDAHERDRIKAEAARRRAARPQGNGASLIDDFNASNSVAAILEMCGYEQSPRHGEDWRSPQQTGESYATRVMDSKWVSLSASDAASGLGEKCASGCYGDAFDLFTHYKFSGDRKSALRKLGAERRSDNVIYPAQFDAEPPAWMMEAPAYEDAPDWGEDEAPPADHAGDAPIAEPAYSDKWPEPVDLWARYSEPLLPRGLLPAVIERFAVTQGEIMGADPAGLAMAALTVCASALPDSIVLQVKRNDPTWRESARLWTALVGPPSRKKTPIFKAALAPLRAIDNTLMRAYMLRKDEYEAMPAAERKAAERPRQKRLIISDATVEAAQEVLRDSPDGVLSEQDELSGWFGAMDKYAPGKGAQADRAFWLKAFNGGTYNLNRIGRGASQIPNLSISLLGGIQPEPIRKLAADSVDDGLVQRLLPVILRPSAIGRDVPSDSVVQLYGDLVGRLNLMRLPSWGNGNGSGDRPAPLHFSPGAKSIRERLEQEHLDLVTALEVVSPKLASHFGKYDGIFARLCLLWHCIDHASAVVPPDEISEPTANSVAKFMEDFLRPSAIAFYAGLLGMSAGHDDLVALASLIVSKELTEVKARDAQRSTQSFRAMTADQFRPLCEKLEAFGWLEKAEPGPNSNTPRWLVNPRVHDRFKERARSEQERRAAAREALGVALGG